MRDCSLRILIDLHCIYFFYYWYPLLFWFELSFAYSVDHKLHQCGLLDLSPRLGVDLGNFWLHESNTKTKDKIEHQVIVLAQIDNPEKISNNCISLSDGRLFLVFLVLKRFPSFATMSSYVTFAADAVNSTNWVSPFPLTSSIFIGSDQLLHRNCKLHREPYLWCMLSNDSWLSLLLLYRIFFCIKMLSLFAFHTFLPWEKNY